MNIQPYVCMRLDAVAPNMQNTVTAIVEILTADGYCGLHSGDGGNVSDVSEKTPYALRSAYKRRNREKDSETTSLHHGESERRIGACFVAHSLGTAVVSWMLHHKSTKHLVASSVLVDPVTFLLCMPKVCASFVHPEPKCVSTYLSSFMLAKELYISNALSRHFNWSYNAVFLENLPGAWEKEEFDDPLNPVARYERIETDARKWKLRTTVSTLCND